MPSPWLLDMQGGPFPLQMHPGTHKVVKSTLTRTLHLICFLDKPVWSREPHHFISFQFFNPKAWAILKSLHKSMTTEVAFPHLPKIPKHTFFRETFLSRALPLQCFNTISRWTLSQVLEDLADEAEISLCLGFLVWKNRANRISPKALLRENQMK